MNQNKTTTTITAKIVRDDDPMSPRDWDNLGTMVCWHNRYQLGDEQPRVDPTDYLEDLPEGTIVLPLYLYDHGGITMSTSGFSCPWDSGQVGFIYVTPERIREEYGDDSERSRETARKVLEGEVKIYAQYLTGDVWGFIAEETKECGECGTPKVIDEDSCFGFFGDDLAGMKDHAADKFHAALDEAWQSR